MAGRLREKTEANKRHAKVAELLLQKVPPLEIASRLRVSRARVYRDIELIRASWREEAVHDIGAVLLHEIAQHASDEQKLRERWEVEAQTKVWLDIYDRILRLQERRAKLMGLNAPDETVLDASTLTEVIATILRVVLPFVPDIEARNRLADEIASIRERYAAGKWQPSLGQGSITNAV